MSRPCPGLNLDISIAIDIFTDVDTKGDAMFRKTPITKICDNLCRAEQLRADALMKLALQGPRI
jgi:hypothetical protein